MQFGMRSKMEYAPDENQAMLESLVHSLREKLDGLVICLSDSWGGLEKVAAQDTLDVASLGLKMKLLCLDGSPIHDNLKDRSGVVTAPLDYRPRNFLDLKL